VQKRDGEIIKERGNKLGWVWKEKSRMNWKMKPEILCHPHIPKPMYGISPRTIMGQEWWNETRQKVYASTNYHCIACGIAKRDAKRHKWLEAHEYWKIDYRKGICEILSIEPLCHYCHNFIHSGRLSIIMGIDKTHEEVREILEHGLQILAENKLKCFPFTLDLAERIGCKTFRVKAYKLPNEKCPWEKGYIAWEDWKLMWEGKEYRSKFSSFDAWKSFYQRKGEINHELATLS
jgi:hypothetical protein